MNIMYCFCEAIYKFEAEESLYKNLLPKIEKLECFKNGKKTEHNFSTKESYLYEKEEFKDLIKWFDACINETLKSLTSEIEKLVITQCWANKTFKDQVHHEHSHGNSFLSGVFYFEDLNEGDGGEITFTKPQTSLWRNNSFINYPTTIFKIRPKGGVLLLFPSQLRHRVDIYKLDTPRYSIAFNAFPSGKIGSYEKATELILDTKGFDPRN